MRIICSFTAFVGDENLTLISRTFTPHFYKTICGFFPI